VLFRWGGMMVLRVRPRWLAPPGIDPATIPFEHGTHFRAFIRGSIIAVLGVAIAFVIGLA
jgi:hypothetical protein